MAAGWRAAFSGGLLLALVLAGAPARADDNIPAPEAASLAAVHSVLLVDVRTPTEWAQTGIPANAHTVSWGQTDFAERILKVAQGDKHAPVVLICRSGSRSARALAFLREHGFTEVRHVPDGMNGWLARGLPVAAWQAN